MLPAVSSRIVASHSLHSLTSSMCTSYLQSVRTVYCPSCSLFNRYVYSQGLVRSSPHVSRHFATGQSPQDALPKKKDITAKRGPMTWRAVGVTLGLAALMTSAMLYFKHEKEQKIEEDRTRALGKASLGGPWELVDHSGVVRKSSDFVGRWVLLYFGFTHCPDVCPDELEKLCKTVDKIDDDKSIPDIIPLFITIDPNRDTVPAVAKYVKEFSAKLIGLTGTSEQIAQAARAYRVYYSEGPKDSDADYIVDHTIILYLIDPKGHFVDYYGQNKTSEEMFNSICLHMSKYAHMMSKHS